VVAVFLSPSFERGTISFQDRICYVCVVLLVADTISLSVIG
jgi:hypothetical protein